MLFMALAVAIGMKIVGHPPDRLAADHPGRGGPPVRPHAPSRWRCSRRWPARSRWRSALGASLAWDTPAGPSIVVVATVLFLLSLGRPRAARRARSADRA